MLYFCSMNDGGQTTKMLLVMMMISILRASLLIHVGNALARVLGSKLSVQWQWSMDSTQHASTCPL